MTVRTKDEQKAYLDGFEMCADCIEKYLTDEGKQRIECLLMSVRNAVEIEDIEQQLCEDCISREQAKDAMYALCDETETFEDNPWRDNPHIDAIIDGLDDLPSVTPKPKTGRWIDIQYFKADDTYYRPKCPFCSIEPKEYSNYCPNCGADMTELKPSQNRVKTELKPSQKKARRENDV